MLAEAEFHQLVRAFPALRGMDADARRLFCERAQATKAAKGQAVFRPGERCTHFLFVLEGEVRVAAAANAREVVLYRVAPGELCVLSIGCALGRSVYPATGETTAPTRAVAIATDDFERLVEGCAVFRRMVFASLTDRLSDVMTRVDEVTFQRLDQRVAGALVAAVERKGTTTLALTHRELADEVGSARELVSRALAQFAEEGWVELGRRRVECTDLEALRTRAESSRR